MSRLASRVSPDEPVVPRSLYLQQLRDRLGLVAVENVTSTEQRNGRLWSQLANWAGEGPISRCTDKHGQQCARPSMFSRNR